MKFLALTALVLFWTVFSLSIVILEEPPAFIAHMFGVVTGLSWVLLVLLHWVRQDRERGRRD